MESRSLNVLEDIFLKRYYFGDSYNEHFQMTSHSKMTQLQMTLMKANHRKNGEFYNFYIFYIIR